MNTSKSLDSILHDFAVNLHPYATGKGQASDYGKYKAQAVAAIVEAVEGLIYEPTKNMPTTYARIMQAIKEWQ